MQRHLPQRKSEVSSAVFTDYEEELYEYSPCATLKSSEVPPLNVRTLKITNKEDPKEEELYYDVSKKVPRRLPRIPTRTTPSPLPTHEESTLRRFDPQQASEDFGQSKPHDLSDNSSVKTENSEENESNKSISKPVSDEYYEDVPSLNESDSDSNAYEIPENPDEVTPDIPDEKADLDTHQDDDDGYTYVDNTAKTSKHHVVPTSPLDKNYVRHIASFGPLSRSISAGQLTIPQQQLNTADQNNLQLNILIQMHQILAQMQATYAQPLYLPSQDMPSQAMSSQAIASTNATKNVEGHQSVIESEQEKISSTECSESATMKKCLG